MSFSKSTIKPQKTNKALHLGPLERKVMQIFWEYPCSTVRSVQTQINQESKATHKTRKNSPKHKLAYTTIMTIMTRLVEKGVLKREKEGNKYCYKPVQNKKRFVASLVKKTMNNFVDKFGQEAMVAFIDEAEKLSPNEKTKLINKLNE